MRHTANNYNSLGLISGRTGSVNKDTHTHTHLQGVEKVTLRNSIYPFSITIFSRVPSGMQPVAAYFW